MATRGLGPGLPPLKRPKAIRYPNRGAVYAPPPKTIRAPNANAVYTGEPPAASPVTPPPAQASARPRPFDAVYDTQLGQNTANLGQTEVGLDQQRDQTIRDIGLDDHTDPFSRARALQRAYHQRQQGTTNSMAARGQLYSGANQSAQSSLDYNRLAGIDSLRKQQSDVLAAIERRRQEARSGKSQADITALSDSTDRAVNTPVDPATVPPPKAIANSLNTTYSVIAAKRRKKKSRGAF